MRTGIGAVVPAGTVILAAGTGAAADGMVAVSCAGRTGTLAILVVGGGLLLRFRGA